jgi:hypothetical protein
MTLQVGVVCCPPVYLVKDDHGEILEGTLYAEELQKAIKTDDVYKIETILKKRKKRRKVQEEKICTTFWVPFFHIASWTPLFG